MLTLAPCWITPWGGGRGSQGIVVRTSCLGGYVNVPGPHCCSRPCHVKTKLRQSDSPKSSANSSRNQKTKFVQTARRTVSHNPPMVISIIYSPPQTPDGHPGTCERSFLAITCPQLNATSGVFLCIRCSGVHRGMGTHISKVKSVDLDTWTPEQMEVWLALRIHVADSDIPSSQSRNGATISPIYIGKRISSQDTLRLTSAYHHQSISGRSLMIRQ